MGAIAATEAAVDARRDQLVGLSRAVHADAETAFEEHTSSARVAEAAEQAGFRVRHGIGDLDTAVVAEYGSGPLVVAVCAEYDALPGIGHACGHNVICAAGVGAAVALAEVADDVGLTVRLVGTPAEEAGGGKVLLLEQGAFDGVHAAMMVHPFPDELDTMDCLAVAHVDVGFSGVSAHASAFPQQGRNAADALTVAQVGIGLLRQHLSSDHRVHGIVTDGGDAPNIVPERAGGTWYARAGSLERLEELFPRVRACFEAGALATGTTLQLHDTSPAYSEMTPDDDLRARYRARAEGLGRTFVAPKPGQVGSTDMANVSLVIPSIHPTVGLATDQVNHTRGFTAACATDDADRAVRDGAIAMAQAAVDAATEPALRDRLLAGGGFDSTGYRGVRFA